MLEEHLSGCELCSRALAELVAEDEFLTDILGLDPAEQAWIDSVDLVGPVMAQVAPRPHLPLILTGLLILLAGALAGTLWEIGAELLHQRVGLGEFIRLVQRLGPELPRLVDWLSRGGLLGTTWPILALGAACGFWRLIRTKETKPYA